MENNWARSLWFAAEYVVIFFVPTMCAMALTCEAGWMVSDDDAVCHIALPSYAWFKGLWAGILAISAYPMIVLGVLNRDHVPEYIYQLFLERQQLFGQTI